MLPKALLPLLAAIVVVSLPIVAPDKLCRRLTAQSMVLLKENKSIFPFGDGWL
jgi:hypothetical protein